MTSNRTAAFQRLKKSGWVSALNDVTASIHNSRLWFRLALIDIRSRYKRTVLGPFWNVLTMAILIATLGVLWSTIFRQDLRQHVPYFSAGYTTWMLIVATFNDHAQAFTANGNIIRSISLPLTVHVIRPIVRNLIMFGHYLIVHALVMLITQTPVLGIITANPGDAVYSYDPITLSLFPVGLAILSLNFVWIGLILAMICARYRDVAQIVISMLQVAFFATPIFWPRSLLQSNAVADNLLANFNPFFHMVDIVRAPLLGQLPSIWTYVAMVSAIFIGFAVALALFSVYRKRVSYWI